MINMENTEDKRPISSDKYSTALYNTLKLNNAYDKDYDTFYNDFYAPGIKGYTYRKEVYDFMKKGGVDYIGDTYEEFASKIGLHAIDPQTQQTPMGADSISKDMTPVEVTPTKKPEAKKEEKPEVSAEEVSENQHPTDTLQDFNPNVSRMRNAGTNYFLQAAEEISNNAYSKSLEELANQAAKDLKKEAYQRPKEDSYVRLNQTARYIPIRSLPKDADLDSVFAAAANFEHMVCGDTKEYTFAPLGGDIQERYEKWKALNINNPGNRYTQETASMSPDAVYIQAKNLKALGYERPAWISELRWNEALTLKDEDYGRITARLQQEDQPRRLKLSNGAYSDSVSLKGMYHENITPTIAEGIYYKGSINTTFVLFQDGRIRPLQAPDPSVLRGGWEAQRELFRRQYEKMTFGEEGKEDYTDVYEKNRVVGNLLQNGEVCHIIYFPYMIEQRRWDDAQELIKIGLGGKFNEEGVLLNPDDRLQIVPVVVKNGESEEDAIAKAKVELDNEISKKLPYKETYLQQQIAQAREALKKDQERLKQFGDHDVVKGSYMPIINPLFLLDRAAASTEEGVKRSDEVALARGNIRKLEESIKKYTQALEALRTGDKVGFWGGFLEGISDLDNWTFGLYNLRENLVAVKAHEMGMGQEAKDRLGLARSLSQESMSAFHRYGEGRFYGPGFGTGYSTPFTLGAIATYGAGNVAARGIIRGGSRMAAKYGTNWFFDTTIRATTRLAAINAAGVIDSSFQMPRIVSDAAIEKMGLMNYTFDENQRIVVTGTQQEKSWGHSLLHSGLNMLIQNASERIGTYVLEPVAKAFGIGKISLRSFGEAFPYNKTIHMIQNGAFAKAMSKVYGTFEKGGYDGFVNEVLEEYIANPMTATFDENYTFADIFDSRQNLDTALSVWASSIFMLGFSSTASSVKYYRTLRSVNSAYDKAEANARRLFGNENWDKIQNTILRLEGEPLVNAIYAGVCQNKSLSDEQKKAFLNYVRAQKAQAVFNNAVSEKYSFSLTGEELNEMNAMTIHAYAEGRNMQTPQEYAQAQQVFADTREMAMSALGVTDDIDAYLDTLGETPAEQLKKGVEVAKENGLDEKAANAALSAYLNAREQQKGAMDGITSDESIRRQHADSVIRQITFENEADSEGGSGKVILVNVKGREKPVFLVRGRYENGSITGETVVVSEGNGVIEMIPASEVEGIVEESDAMTERQRQYDKIDAENKEQQRLINLNMDTPLAGQGGILMDEEGHRRQVGIKCVFNDEQGNPASVLVVDQNNNDYLIPIDVFREQRGRGRKFEAIEPYLDETDEEYHAAEGPMNEEYNLANKEQEVVSEEDAQGAAEGVTPQPATDATEKPTKPEVKYDYHVKMKDGSGNAVSGRVTNLSADGVEIEFDAPYNGKMVDRIPLADFDNGVSEIADANGNVLWNETEAVGDTEVVPQVDAAPTQVGQNEIDESEEARQARINSSEYKYDKEMRVYGYTGHLYDYRNGVAIYLDEEGNPFIYLAAQNDNTYIGLFRDDSGMWSTKMENASNDKTVFKGLISAVMDMLPEGAKFYEHSNVSVDGLRVFAQQLNHGFKVSDETYECGLNGEDKANVLGSKFKGNGKFASIEHATEADLEHFKGVLKPYMEALGRTTDDIRLGEDGKVLLTLPILIKEGTNTKAGEDVSASDVSNTQKNPTRPIHESASDEVDTKPTGSQDEAHKPTALERIPKDENGNPIYEQTDAETAFTGLTEEAGNVIEAEEIAKSMVEDKEKALEKAKKIKLPSGVSVAEKVKAAKVRTQAIAKAQEELDKWKAIAEVPAQQRAKVVEERIAKEKAEAEAKRKAEEEAKRANEEAESELNSTIENVLNTLYKKGKDYASKIFNMKFFDFAKTPDFMKHLGMTGSKFTIRYGVIARHFGKDGSHDFTQSEWEQIPHAIEHPFAITQLKNKEKGFRIYTALKTEKGEYVVVGVDVKNAGRDMEVNAIATMFGRRSNANLSENEEVIYKSKEITPEQEALLSRPNSDQYPAERELSTDKVTESAPSTQENGPKNSTQSAIESASAEVETSPTEAQKKAGNYKMGHVKVGAFDVTIENPKGSERSGTDANGKRWSVKMNNTYGYIRGTEGVDGDHIDVFLAEDMDKWDGKYVFVVDQYNPDGTFDEHKVMLGFNSTEEARSAYLSNYEKGWENGRRIVVARIKTDGFQKWVDSSHRKTKPFAHYVIAGAADVSDNEKKPSASKKGKPRVSKEDEVKRTVEHFPMETPEEAAAFDKRIPEMEDSELLAYMQEDGKGDANKAYHMNIYDEYDYRHTDEQTEAYDIYIQQLHDSNTTLEQAEEMLGNILGDVERFATDERSQLIGQSDALQDYITELERQKEDKRAEAENSAENTDANHVGAADVEENKSAEPVEADKSKQYGEYQEVYDNFVSDVENRGMIPDLRAIKNKIRDTKRRLTVLRNGAATSIQSDEDLKRFETAEKKLTDLLHVYEAMRDYTEARIKKAEAAAQRKPWSEKNAQERMDEASKNPLTEEEIQNAPTDEVNKANALDYLNGNHGLIQSISYLKVYEDVRNPNGSAASDSGTKDKTQLAGRSNSASEGRDTGGKSGGTAGRVDNGGSREDVSEQSDGGKSGERSTRDNAGEGSNTDIPTEEQPVGRRGTNSGKPRRGGTSGRTRSDGGRSGRGESGNPATENGTRRAASESVKEESADDFLNQALGEFKDVLDDFIKAGRGELSISLVGLNSKQMEMLPRLIQVGAKVGYAYIRKGVHGFTEWAKHVKEAIGKYLRDANLSDDEIDAFIKEMWKSKIPFDGQIHTLEEWASIYSKKDLRNKVRTTIEEKREAQRQAESISVKTGDINNIRETLPFLLPQQQEDVLRAETQFFDETHQDREHANGKGYMFTNGTGTGKTYTGLGIVKRFVKQGKKRILILTPSQPKVRDWINDGKNLGLEIKSLDDWAKERGTTATTEAGEGTIITTYANFRQNEELLNGTFDLIVYDESHRIMENKNAANTIGTNQHHMIANRDILQATVRLRKINPIYQKLNKVHEEFMAKRENLVSQGLIPYSFNVDNWNEEDAERFPDLAKLRKRYLELRDVIVKEVDPQIEEQAKKDAAHTKVVFLSATPFNTRENIDYAQGYIFSYPDKEQARGYSIASPQTIFFEEHFGAAYKWRYGRLEHSERNAEAIAQQEREFSDWLQHTLCTMSGRIIDSEYDYSRDFPVVSVEHAEEINNAAEEILRDKYFNMAYHKVFGNYNYAGALFETLKVATLIPRIKQHLEAGRKVVIFHRRVESKTPLIPPFAAMLSACHAIIDEMKMKNKPKEEIDAARHRLEELKEKWRGLLKWESMLDYSMPREQIAKAFGADNVLYFSGQESTKVKNQAVDSFNNDESGKNIIVIQEASGKEGISLHDTTGKHQRVLITLALPQSPITALQIEGRIYRIGNRSNAIFEYPLLGLNSEIILFGQKFNGQIGTTENLALGSQARNLRESFARSVEESGKDVPIEEQGFGGKEADAAERDETSPFDRAVLDYYGNQKLKGKRDSREGVDYYPTPEPLGFKMVEWGNLNDGETALEPSAGHGAIARYVPSANPLTAIEPSQNLFAKLQLKAGGSGRKFVNTIFEGYNVVNKHDVIFMNPPFGTGGRLAVDHVAKAFTHLTEGGRIVAIIPRGSTDKKFDKWIDEQENAVVTGEIMLPDITFQQAGTSVMARVLVIDKVTNQSLRSEAESKYRRIDLSRRKYDKIEDFFEDIRDIQMPSRTIDEKARMLKRAAPALRDIKELKGVVDVQAQDDGIDIRTKGSAMGFYLDLTVSDFSLQQQLRTKYQRYAQEIEWNEHRHNEKAVEIYKAYNDLVCRLLGKTAEEVESDITREKMGLEQPHEEQGVAINVAPQAEESPSSEQNESTTESSPYHYELKHHTKTGAEMFMAMPNEKSGLSSEEYSSMLAKAKKHGGYWNRFMKGFAFPSEKSAKDFLAETGNTEPQADERYQKAGTPLTPNSAEVALRDAIADLMRKSGLDVIDHEVGQQVLDEANGRGTARTHAMIASLTKAAYTIRGWITGNKRGKSFTIELPETTRRMIRKVMGRDFDSHNITANGVAHAQRNHGVGGQKLNEKSIPLTEADMELIPYIMTAPDYVRRGSDDVSGRVSVRFYKELSNGYVVVAEKEYKNSPDDMETITMWAEMSDKATNAQRKTAPDTHVQNAILDIDAAKIRKDAENAIAKDQNIREHRVYHGSGIRFFRTSNGEAYGFTVGGKIYIDQRIATAETPIHEYAHLWATAMREGNPTEWKNIVGLMKGTSVWAEVQKLYPELKNDDDIADEVLATFSGRRGAERLRAEQQKIMQSNGSVFEKAAAVGALARVKQALSKFWKGVADFLGIHYTSAEEVADRVMKDLLEGVDPRKYGGKNDERVRKQFIGEKGASAADHAEEVGVRLDNLAVARKMEEAGKDAKAIKMATGWERGADGKWRYEVGDVRFYDGLQLVNRNEKSTVTLNDLLEDNKEKDALFASYPSLKDMTVTLEDMGYNGAGEYSYKDKSLRLNTYLLTDDSGRFTEPAVSILNHEIQHAIQHIEGFARGGSLEEGQHYADEHKPLTPVQGDFVDTVNLYDKNKHTLSETYTLAKFVKDWAMFNDDDFSKDLLGMSDEQIRSEYERLKERQQHGGKSSRLNGFDAYKRFSGEVESRNVEARMGMTDEERRASLAAETEDVAREDQIFLQDGLNGVSESREPSIWLPKDEYAKVAHAIATNTGFKKTGMNEVFTDNNYYIYTAKKNGDFIVRFGLPIEGNEDIINELSKGVEDGTIRNTRSLYSVIERERSEQNENNYNYVNAEGRQKSTGAIGNLALRQQADSTGSDGYLGEEIPGRTPAGNSDRGAGREAGGVSDSNLYRQSEITPHAAISSESKSQAAQKATENLNLGGRVVVHESAEGLEGREATAKGWYDTRTGQIHVVLSNNADAADVTQTILHEAVAHHGLRELFGHNVMDAFLDSVLAAASQEVKDAINELRRGNGWNFRTATEEYLAGLAERTDFERMTAEERGLFATIRRLFNRALEFLGLKNHELSDRELAYILWCSYQNLKTGEKGRYVAEAERIAMRYKLKAGKNAMTDTEKKESAVLLRGKLDNLQEILAKDTYERLVTSGSHLERTAWVDMLSPLQDLQHAIEKNGGFKLGDFENPYNAYVTMSSRNYAQMDIYKRTLYADMIEAIHALGSETGRSYEEIKTYVMAKHGMERQKYMAEKAAEEAYDRYKSMHPFGQKTLDDFIDEYEEKSFAGLTELFGTQSVSDAMDEAQKYVDEVEAEAGSLVDSLWDSIRAATKSSLQRAYEAGLISKETYDNVSSMYQYYIPLRGFDETTSDEVYEYFGDQTINGGTGSFMKKAKGRKSVADDPFAVIGNMAEMAIMQSNRNLMKQQLLNLALNHPSDLISVSDLYVKFDEDYDNGDGTRGAWVPVAVPDTSGMTTEEANQVMLDFQDDMEEKVKDEPDTYALAHQKPHIPYRVLGRNMNEHQVMVKRGGKTYILTINGNPRAAQAINGLLNPDATENPGAIALKAMTNWIARMATARNVEFAISNAMRDLEFSTTLIPKEGTEYYGRYVKNYLTCVKNIGRLVNRLNGNTLDMSNPLEKAFYDFIYNGGETGYTFMKGVERYKGEITKALSELRAKEGKSKIERLSNKVVYGHHYVINDAWNIYMKGAEYLSRCTEDWVRFAVFLTSRQMGRSMEQSIMDAKEVTINFNRKGAGSKSAGKWDVPNFFSMNNLHFLSAYAASAFKNFYAFSNASIQGLDKNVRLHLNHTAGMLMWDGAAVALGMLSAMCIPLMLSAIGGDPDDYWDMPDSMRRMGIMLPLGKDGRFLTLPMSIEHRAAYGIGELLGTVVCGSENLPASEITFQAFEQLSQILPLDLTEGNGSMLSLVPTAVRPEVEIAFNKNWLGMPIYKEPFNKNTPAFRNVYQSTNPNYIAMSKWLNEVQGGGDYERAGVQVNPAMVQHLVESYTGGAGKFVSRTSGVIAKIIQGEQIRSNEIPFYRTLVKSVDDRTHNRAARERFQREYDKGQKLIYKIDNYQKESARGNSQYVKELDEFAKSKDFMSYMLWKSYNSVKSQFDNARSYIGDDKDKRAALDHAQMLVQKMMTECARAVEDSKTQEEADEKIGRIQSEYTPQIKETLIKVED